LISENTKLTSLQEIYRDTHSWTRASEVWALGATVYTMMTGMPPPRFYNYEWQISRMNDKGFSEALRDIVAEMLRPHPKDRMQTKDLVNQVDDAWEGWRATTEEGAHYVDVLDKVVLRSALGASGALVL
jgi:serine/threonine protein kinase